jgi:RimJ/RimL family protein N-acetyltransferase
VARLRFPILTERLVLRPFGDEDLDALHAIHGRADVTRYLYWEPRSRAETAEMVGRMKTMTGIGEAGEALRLAGLRRDSGELIGDFSLRLASREHRQGEVGFVMHPDHHGHGFAAEASFVVLRLGFEEYGLHRIIGRCDARNTPSARLMERLGMRREAHFRENEFVKGDWTDELVYALLASEWTARRS